MYPKIRPKIVKVVVITLLALTINIVAAVAGQPTAALAYETATSFQYPLDESDRFFLGQAFGAWNSSRNAYHLAEDLLPVNGWTELPVYAPANGQVRHSGYQSGYGYVLVIEHRLADGTYVCSVLGHLKAAGLPARGASVRKGQLVGYISNSIYENGGYPFAHLHFGIRSGQYSTTRDWDGGWRYRGYAASTAIRDLWYHPTNFVKKHSVPSTPGQQIGSPSLNVSLSSIGFGYVRQWRYTTPKSYTVTGSNLTGALEINAPSGVWISTSYASGYQKTLKLQPRNGSINQRIYVSFLPSRTGRYAGYITHSSPGVETRRIGTLGWGY